MRIALLPYCFRIEFRLDDLAGHYLRIARHTSQPLLMGTAFHGSDADSRRGAGAWLVSRSHTVRAHLSARLGPGTVGVTAAALHRAVERLSVDLACGARFHVSGPHNYLMECERKLADSPGVDAKRAMLAN